MLENTFDYGQVYVALSRVKSVAGLWLSKPLRAQSIRANPEVLKFYHSRGAQQITTKGAHSVANRAVQVQSGGFGAPLAALEKMTDPSVSSDLASVVPAEPQERVKRVYTYKPRPRLQATNT